MDSIMRNRNYQKLKRKEFKAVMSTISVFQDGIDFLPPEAKQDIDNGIKAFQDAKKKLTPYWKKA